MSNTQRKKNHHDEVEFDNKTKSYRRLACRNQETKEHELDLRDALHKMETKGHTL